MPQRSGGNAPAPGTQEKKAGGRLREWWMHGLMVVLLAGLCAGLYGWTLDFPMEFDDHVYLVNNPLFGDAANFHYLANFVDFVNRPARMGADPDFAVNFILRPVAYASFYWNYLLDGFNPRTYRLINVVIHACNGILLYALLQVLLASHVRQKTLGSRSAWFIPAAAAFLFVAHPLATESVTYIVQRFTSMAVMFSLLALCLHFLSLQVASRRARLVTRIASVIAMLLAMQTKESSFMVPFLAVVLHKHVLGSTWKSACRSSLPLLACTPLIPILLMLTVAAQNHGFVSWENLTNIVNNRDEPVPHGHYLVTQFTAVACYLRLLVWPAGLNLDPEWPIYHSLWQGPVLAAVALLTAILGLAWLLRWKCRNDVRAALLFSSVLWFFLAVSVSSGIPLPDMVAEHRSYLASIGIFIVLALLLDWLRTVPVGNTWFRRVAPAGAACIILALSCVTFKRNEVWRSSVSLWQDTVARSPGKSRAWGNLGTAYARSGNQLKAAECYRRSLSLCPENQVDMRNLAVSLIYLNEAAESLELTRKLIALNGGKVYVAVAEVMGAALTELKRYEEALAIHRGIVAEDPDNASANMGIGIIFQHTGSPSRALPYFYRALQRLPGDERVIAAIREAEKSGGIAAQ